MDEDFNMLKEKEGTILRCGTIGENRNSGLRFEREREMKGNVRIWGKNEIVEILLMSVVC